MTSILEEPYMMLRKPIRGEKLYGNDQYEGYCKDLADAITKHTGIKFLIRPVADGKYGSPDPHNPGGWNGEMKAEGETGTEINLFTHFICHYPRNLSNYICIIISFRNGGRACQEGGGDRDRPPHHQLSEGAGGGLHQALHVSRDLHHDQGADQAAAGRVHLHEPPEHGDLDVCRVCLHRSQHCAFSCQQVPSISSDLVFCITRL